MEVNQEIFQETLSNIKAMHPNKLALDVEKTAELLGIERQTIYNSMRKNIKSFPIKHRKVGRKLRFNIVDIAKFLSQ
ncbi:MAG: helix-turn-helix domain-containing protein [Desulfobacterales bacterium]|nr:helix-turn-helix domain-containing protein [Desulfobacterales bacterium]